MKDHERGQAIINFKIRASAGITGNDRITSYSYLSQMGLLRLQRRTQLRHGSHHFGNPELKWETTLSVRDGARLDFSKAVSPLTADYYLWDTHDMLYNASILRSRVIRHNGEISGMTNQALSSR